MGKERLYCIRTLLRGEYTIDLHFCSLSTLRVCVAVIVVLMFVTQHPKSWMYLDPTLIALVCLFPTVCHYMLCSTCLITTYSATMFCPQMLCCDVPPKTLF